MLLLWIIYVIFILFLLRFRARLFIDALWSPAGKGLTSWLSFVMSKCEVVTFPLVFWVRCGARLYRFLIFPFSYFYINLVQNKVTYYAGEKLRIQVLISSESKCLVYPPYISPWLNNT